jgi:hypothetical protein
MTKPKPKARSSALPKPKPSKPITLAAPKLRTRRLSKTLVLRMLLAKLEVSKTCDWHALSLQLAPPKGKRGSSKGMSGSDLHEVYHNVSRRGREGWREGE